MRQRIVIRPAAQRDVADAAEWYENQRSGLGKRFLGEFGELLDRIANGPARFPVIAWDIRRALMNRFPYAVYFAVSERCIAVIAVLHQSRHPTTWKQRG